jgi:exonuclease V
MIRPGKVLVLNFLKRSLSNLATFKGSEINTKKYDLKLPNNSDSNKQYFTLDEKLKVIQYTDANEESIIDEFILPLSSGAKASDTYQKTNLSKMRNLLTTFHIDEGESLPLSKPGYIKETPFEYHSKYNSDTSYVSIPRLSVTKLLTFQWCELREFYTIFSGSPVKKETKEMKLGTEAHLKLELETHNLIDVEDIERITDEFVEKKIDSSKRHINTLADPDDILLAKDDLSKLTELLHGAIPESSMANEWMSKIISRLFTLINTSEAREVLVHGYLDFQTSHFTSNLHDFQLNQLNLVLVSGVVDYLKLFNPHDKTDYSMFEDIQDHVEFTYLSQRKHQWIDLSQFLKDIDPIIKEYSDTYKIAITDVKTRSWNKLPQQESVLQAAKLQVEYYRNMFGILAGEFDDIEIGYEMLLENAKRRNLDVDKPISIKSALALLKANHTIILKDYVKLANGEAIGFESFDRFSQERYLNQGSEYDFTKVLEGTNREDYISQIKASDKDGFDFDEILTSDILKAWKIPLTLRYFAARSSQLFHLCKPFLSDSLSIEYHNIKNDQCFHTNYYNYNANEIDEVTAKASAFWNGTRPPIPVQDLSKCNYCDFSSRCVIPNPHKNVPGSYGSVGSKMKHFI